MPTLPLASIIVGERKRRDLGNLDDLADSLDSFGLIQPIVVNQNNELVAGGRRYAAASLLGWTEIDCVLRETLSHRQLRELELEENIKRKEMTWQECALAMLEIHVLKKQEAVLAGNAWRGTDTAQATGFSTWQVSVSERVGRELRDNPTSPVWKADSLKDGLAMLLRRQEEAATALLKASTSVAGVTSSKPTIDDQAVNSLAGEEVVPVQINLAKFARRETDDSLFQMRALPAGSVDHIITDPPYAIDMANLQQQNTGMDVSRTATEHQVDPNNKLLTRFLLEASRVIRDPGFCVFWCDMDNWDWLKAYAKTLGFTPCRWPLVWCKPPGQAMNQAAGFNATKATEIALVLRKGTATLAKNQPVNWRVIAPDAEDRAFDHPFAKPFACWEWLLDAFTLPGQLVLDPFAGVGTCPCACIRLGRQWLAFELVDAHFQQLLTNTAKSYVRTHSTNRFDFTYEPEQTASN